MKTPGLDFDQYLDLEATRDLFDHMRDVVWVNLLSLPSLALPNGIQLVARRFRGRGRCGGGWDGRRARAGSDRRTPQRRGAPP